MEAPTMRKRLRVATSQQSETSETSLETVTLQTAIREIRQLQEEGRRQRAEFEELLRQRDDEFHRLEERFRRQQTQQLSLSNNRETSRRENNFERNVNNLNINDFGYKLKPDSFDGSVPLREFMAQFNLIARANNWNDSFKTVSLAACLRGKARSILDGMFDIENLRFEDLKSKLELRFGEGHLSQTYYMQFTNRKQKFLEDLPTLGTDLERLSRLAYPECSHEIRDKIACAQFVAALSDGFIKRTLQLENVSSLKSAVERAMAIKVIQENSFSKDKYNRMENKNKFHAFNKQGNKFEKNEKDNGKKSFEKQEKFNKYQKGKFSHTKKECWQCGAQGHFRSECPTLAENKG